VRFVNFVLFVSRRSCSAKIYVTSLTPTSFVFSDAARFSSTWERQSWSEVIIIKGWTLLTLNSACSVELLNRTMERALREFGYLLSH
jgi:hypothetical protein